MVWVDFIALLIGAGGLFYGVYMRGKVVALTPVSAVAAQLTALTSAANTSGSNIQTRLDGIAEMLKPPVITHEVAEGASASVTATAEVTPVPTAPVLPIADAALAQIEREVAALQAKRKAIEDAVSAVRSAIG